MPKHRNRQRLKKTSGEGVWGKLADAYVRFQTRQDDSAMTAMDAYGECRPRFCQIFYASAQDEQQLRDTIWHEILHAIASETGIAWELKPESDVDVDEEMVVRRFATATLQVMRDNPSVVKFLNS